MELKIESSGMNGEGVVRFNGKVYFVNGGVVGDVVEAKITKENSKFGYMEIEKVISPSENRCLPKCKYFGACGGCSMQHITYTETLKIKRQNIEGLFNKAGLKVSVSECEKSQFEYSYRNKLTMFVTKSNNLGFYKQNSKELIEINRCELVSESFNKLINKLNIFLKQNIEFSPLILKGMAIREINNLFIINLILNKKINLNKLENYLRLNKINYSLYYCLNNNPKSILQSYPYYFVGGEKEVFVNEFEIKYPIYPLSFLQVNNLVKKNIYSKIIENVGNNKVVLDAYSGAGLLSAIIAKQSSKVIAVEIDESASRASTELAKINHIKNMESICGDCANVVPNILNKNKIDVIILDPARKGVDEKTLNAVANAGAEKIIYLSCNPATLVRDLKVLVEKGGFIIKSVTPYDMFPWTSEVEILVVLEK